MKPKALLATLLLAAALTALWLAARPPSVPFVATTPTPPTLPTSRASPAAVFVSPLSPLPTPRPALTAASLPPATAALTDRLAAGRPTRIIDGTPAPTATRGPSPTPPFTPTPTHALRIENVRLGPDLRITYLDDGRPFIYDLTDGSNRPAAPGAAAQPALTSAPPTGPTSPDGRLIASQTEGGAEPAIAIRERTGLWRTLRLPGVLPVAWSPDSSYALAVAGRDPGQPTRLFVVDLAQWRVFTLARAWQGRVTAVWAPGSRRLALEVRDGADAGLWLLDIADDWINPLAPGNAGLGYDALQWPADDELIARQVQLTADAASQGRALLWFRLNGEFVKELAGLATGVTAGLRDLPSRHVPDARHTYGMLQPYGTGAALPTPALPRSGPQPTLTPAADPVSRAAQRWLTAPGRDFCPPNAPPGECTMPLIVGILDFIAQHPGRPENEALQQRVMLFGGGDDGSPADLPIGWLADDWLAAHVRLPFEQAGGLPADFRAQWRGEVFESDLDDDGRPDYLLTVRIKLGDAPVAGFEIPGGLVWLRPEGAGYALTLLPTGHYGDEARFPAYYPEVKTIADLNGDGRLEVAYTVRWCGASTCLERLRILAWQDDSWRNLLITGGWQPMGGLWRIQDDDGDGRAEVIGPDRGPGIAGLGPQVPYDRRFVVRNGEWVPVADELRGNPNRGDEIRSQVYMVYVRWLIRDHRLPEAATLLDALMGQLPPDYYLMGYQPFALFNLGAVQALLDAVPAAQATWDRLLAAFPDHPLSLDVVALRTQLHTRADWPALCAQFGVISRPTPAQTTGMPHPIGNAALMYEDVCSPLLLFDLWTWPRGQSLAYQLAHFGRTWQLLTDQYDLNGDGVADPLGLVGSAGQPWAFISAGAVYRPLPVWSAWPLGALPPSKLEASDWNQRADCQSPRVSDRDRSGRPELLIACPSGFDLWVWRGNRFQGYHVTYGVVAAGQYQWFTGPLTETTTASGSELRVQLFRDAAMTQPVGEWVYHLAGDELRLISQEPWPALAPLAEAFEALFRRGQPEQALAALARYDPSLTTPRADGYSLAWRTAMARYLTALALDYAGRSAEARTLLAGIAQEYPDTGWAVLAKERLGP